MTETADRPAISILLVCMGNICRSPMAHGVVRYRLQQKQLFERIRVDSAGTHGYHAGAPPDDRAQAATRRRGIEISDLQSRLVTPEDIESFDVILAMDDENLQFLRELSGDEHQDKLHLFMEFALDAAGRSVPDPYYGGPIGFERVLDMVEDAADGLIERLESLLAREGSLAP